MQLPVLLVLRSHLVAESRLLASQPYHAVTVIDFHLVIALSLTSPLSLCDSSLIFEFFQIVI